MVEQVARVGVVDDSEGQEQLGRVVVEGRGQFGEFGGIGEVVCGEEVGVSSGEQCRGLVVGLVGALPRGSGLSRGDG